MRAHRSRLALAAGFLSALAASPAMAQVSEYEAAKAFADERTLRVTAQCVPRVVADDGGDPTSIEKAMVERQLGRLDLGEELGSAVVISGKGHVLGARHTIDELVERFEKLGGPSGERHKTTVGERTFQRVCSREDVTLTFARPDFYREDRTFPRAYDPDVDAFITKLERSDGAPLTVTVAHACFAPDLINNLPAQDLSIRAYGYVENEGIGGGFDRRTSLFVARGFVNHDVEEVRDHGSLGMGDRARKGMSGGPVLDLQGRLIGVVRGYVSLEAERGIERNLFVPIQRFSPILMKYGTGWNGPECGAASTTRVVGDRERRPPAESSDSWEVLPQVARVEVTEGTALARAQPQDDAPVVLAVEPGTFVPHTWCRDDDSAKIARRLVGDTMWLRVTIHGRTAYLKKGDGMAYATFEEIGGKVPERCG